MRGHDSVDVMVKNGAIRRRGVDATADHDAGAEQHPLLKLQRQMGNAFVARMLAQREDEGGELEEEEIQAKHDPSLVQRQDEGGELEEEEIQAKHDPALAQRANGEAGPEVGLEGGPISSDLSSRIQSKRGAGSSLDGGTKASMEGSFGNSFDDVRIHHDDESDALNRSISAKAFTTGSDIFFSRSASPSDSQLMAHELTHVVQQRSMSHGGPMTVGPAGDSHEQAADSVASAVTTGAPAAAQRLLEDGLAPAAMISRDEAGELEEEEMS